MGGAPGVSLAIGLIVLIVAQYRLCLKKFNKVPCPTLLTHMALVFRYARVPWASRKPFVGHSRGKIIVKKLEFLTKEHKVAIPSNDER